MNVRRPDHHTLFFEGPPRRDVRVMVQRGDHDFVAGPQLSPNRARQRECNRGHILPKDHFIFFTIEKIGHRSARRGDDRVIVAAGDKRAASVRIRMQKIILHRVHHLPRHLRSRRAIQKRRGPPVHLQL